MGNKKSYSLILGMGYDAEILGKLETVKSNAGYIKELIRKDIAGELAGVNTFTEETAELARQYRNAIEEKYKEQFDNNSEKTVVFACSFSKGSDLIEKLDSVENKSEYVKQLILTDMGLVDTDGNRFVLPGMAVNQKRKKDEKRLERQRELQKQYNEKLDEEKKAAHREAQKRYREKTGYAKDKEYKSKVKRIPLDVNLDFFEFIDNHIKTTGEPRNVFIKRAIQETIERDNKG